MNAALTVIICLLGLLPLLCSVIVFCCIRVGAASDYHLEIVKEKNAHE